MGQLAKISGNDWIDAIQGAVQKPTLGVLASTQVHKKIACQLTICCDETNGATPNNLSMESPYTGHRWQSPPI